MNGYVIGLKHFPLDIYAAAGNIPMWNENFFQTVNASFFVFVKYLSISDLNKGNRKNSKFQRL